MRLKKIIRSILFTATIAAAAQPAAAQDLLARQTPVDRKMKVQDTLSLQQYIDREYSGLPAEDLYPDWNNKYAHLETALPETYRIDLRDFCMPTVSRAITSNFGPRGSRAHKGIDVKVYVGDTIRAAFTGKVRIVRYEARGYGKYIVIRHDNGLETIYGHLSKQLVREDQEVRAGDPIGLGGNTGRSTGSHLHFETRLCGVALNPATMFDFRAQDVVGDFYTFNKNTYKREAVEANRVRGMRGNGSYTPEQVRGTQASQPAKQPAYAATTERKMHKVQSGETLYSISRRYNVPVDQLCRLNHVGKDYRVKVGQLIIYQ